MVNIGLVLFYRLVKSLWMQTHTENKNKHGVMGLMNIEAFPRHQPLNQPLMFKTVFSSVHALKYLVERASVPPV